MVQKVRIYLWRGRKHEVVKRSLPSTTNLGADYFGQMQMFGHQTPGALAPYSAWER
jgi:hypothetical protein